MNGELINGKRYPGYEYTVYNPLVDTIASLDGSRGAGLSVLETDLTPAQWEFLMRDNNSNVDWVSVVTKAVADWAENKVNESKVVINIVDRSQISENIVLTEVVSSPEAADELQNRIDERLVVTIVNDESSKIEKVALSLHEVARKVLEKGYACEDDYEEDGG